MTERRANARTMTKVRVADEVRGEVEDEVEVVGDMGGRSLEGSGGC
jgi:hypothetical protein